MFKHSLVYSYTQWVVVIPNGANPVATVGVAKGVKIPLPPMAYIDTVLSEALVT